MTFISDTTAHSHATLPPGPRTPALAQAIRLLADPLGFLEGCQRRHGDIFTLRYAALGTVVHLTHPADIRTLFTADPEVAFAGEANYSLFGPIVGRGTLFTMEGAAHRQRRKLVMPAFHGERMQEYAGVMRDATLRAVARWPVGTPIALHPEMQDVTLQVILRAVFGLGDGPESFHLRQLLAQYADIGIGSPLLLLPYLQWDLGPKSPWGRVTQLRRDTHLAIEAEIRRRRAANDAATRTDILSLLLETRDEDGAPLSDEQLRDELVLLLIAGHETTAASLAWAFSMIFAHRDVVAKIHEELQRVCGGAMPSRADYSELVYLDAVIKESMRLRPITPTTAGRWLKAPLKVRDYTLPPGVLVTACGSLVHRRPEIYSEPLAFRPERFLGTKVDPYAWLPFGGGVRRCLGMAFALYEIKIIIATVLMSGKFDLVAPPSNGRRGFFIAPRDGTRVIFRSRASLNN